METDISEQFYETIRGLDLKDKAVASRLQEDGMPLVESLCEQRCARCAAQTAVLHARLLVSRTSMRPQPQRMRCSCAAPKKKRKK